MELALGPPSKIAAGVSLNLPVVVTFTTARTLERGNHGSKGFEPPDLSGAWAFVSLTTPDMQQSLAPPRTDLLRGRTADSVHPVHQDQEDCPTLAYATFRELMITQPGRYRMKVNIIDMNTLFAGDSAEGGATVLPSIHSPVFDVVEGEAHGACGKQPLPPVQVNAKPSRGKGFREGQPTPGDWNRLLDTSLRHFGGFRENNDDLEITMGVSGWDSTTLEL